MTYFSAMNDERGGFGGPGHGRGHGGPRGPRRGRGRAQRGDVRAAVLTLLGEQPMHGYEMIQVLGERTHGAWKPSPGSVYPALSLLEDEGLIVADAASGKRRFSLTDAGREALEALPKERAPWEQVTDGMRPDEANLRDGVGLIITAARQVAEAGNDTQRASAVEVLAETRRKLYAILAEEA